VPAARIESAFVSAYRRAHGPWTEDTIYGAGYPAWIGCAPVNIIVAQIDDPFRGHVMSKNVVVNVYDTLGLTGGSRCIEQVERIFGIHMYGVEFFRSIDQQLFVSQLTALQVAFITHDYYIFKVR